MREKRFDIEDMWMLGIVLTVLLVGMSLEHGVSIGTTITQQRNDASIDAAQIALATCEASLRCESHGWHNGRFICLGKRRIEQP